MCKIIVFILLSISISLFAFEDKVDVNKTISIEVTGKKDATSIKDIYKALTCNDCCFPLDDTLCNIFYYSCKDLVLKDHEFLYSNKNLTDSNIANKINNNRNKLKDLIKTILFVENKTVYFSRPTYRKFSENIKQMLKDIEKNYSEVADDAFYQKSSEIIKKNLKKGKKQVIKRERLYIYLNKLDVESFIKILSLYNNMLHEIDTDHKITVYKPNLESSCRNKYRKQLQNPTTISNKNTDLLIIDQSTDAFNNNSIINYPKINKLSESSSANKTIIIASVAGAVFIIVVVVVVLIYKFHKKKLNKNKLTAYDEETAIKNNCFNDHIYEEPYFADENIKDLQKYDTNNELFVNALKNNNYTTTNNSNSNSEQNSASSDIVISSINSGNKPLTVIVVEPDKCKIIETNQESADGGKSGKAILIRLPDTIETNCNTNLYASKNEELAIQNPENAVYDILEDTNNTEDISKEGDSRYITVIP